MDDVVFYSTAAQVIPVLLLALIFERRGNLLQLEFKPLTDDQIARRQDAAILEEMEAEAERTRSRPLEASLGAIALLVLVAGESLALSVTVSGRATTWTKFGVGGAIVVGIALVLWPLLLYYVERVATVAPWLRGHTYVATWTLLCAIFILSAAWW